MKHTLLIKTVCLVLFTVILSAALTALVFRYAGIKKYGELKTKELIPRAEFISSRAADLMEGILSRKDFENIVNYDILKTLEEYWFDDEGTFEKWKNRNFIEMLKV